MSSGIHWNLRGGWTGGARRVGSPRHSRRDRGTCRRDRGGGRWSGGPASGGGGSRTAQGAAHRSQGAVAAGPGAYQRGERSGKLQGIAFARKAASGQRVVDQGGQRRSIAVTMASRKAIAAQLDLVAHAQHAGSVDVAVIEASTFDGLKRAQQAFRDVSRLLGSERTIAQYLRQRLIERLQQGVHQRLVPQASGAGP